MSRFAVLLTGICFAHIAIYPATAQDTPNIELPSTTPVTNTAPEVIPPEISANTQAPTEPPAAPATAYSTTSNAAAIPASGNLDEELIYRTALGRAEDVKLLINRGANPNILNKQGMPLLFVAVSRNDVDGLNVVAALLDNGAKINTKNKDGQTALFEAARNGNAEMVQYLLDRGIDYYALDNFGDIARTLAFRGGHDKVVKLMDDFVKYQTAQTLKLDEAAQMMSQTQRDRIAEAERKKIEEIEKKKEEERKKAEAIAQAEKLREIAEEKKRREEYERNVRQLDQKVHDLAYEACAFQYWSFCRDEKQTVSIPRMTVHDAVEYHRKNTEGKALEIMRMFEAKQDYVNGIINPSKQFIFDELDAMPSRTYRKENGVGTVPDLKKRCGIIADVWQVSKPKH